MIGLLQRVTEASVTVEGEVIGAIDRGLMVLVGIEKNDTETEADRLLKRLLGYRVFADAEGKMNRSVIDVEGSLLLVPQFTLPADTNKGTRPSFSAAASPELGKAMFDYLVARAKQTYAKIEAGRFGADMKVALVNDGPVTLWLQVNN